MNQENNNQTNVNPYSQSDNQESSSTSTPKQGGKKVIQPSEAIKQEMQAQPQVMQPTTPASPNPQQNLTPNPASLYPDPTSGQMQVGMSSSQMGYNQPKNKLMDLNPRQLIIKGVIGLVILGGIFTALVMTNIVALSEFKNISYTNSKGTNFKMDFYSKHGSKQLKSGNKQLVSKVSKDGNFPIVFSISTVDGMSGYNRAKDCVSYKKVLDVQNNNLNQKISVCDIGKQGYLPSGGVYIAGFIHNNKVHIVTIGQDYGDINLSSQSGAQESLTRFGIEPYNADIERIISSIVVE